MESSDAFDNTCPHPTPPSDGKFLPKWKKPAEETGRNRPGRNLVSATSGRNWQKLPFSPKISAFCWQKPKCSINLHYHCAILQIQSRIQSIPIYYQLLC